MIVAVLNAVALIQKYFDRCRFERVLRTTEGHNISDFLKWDPQ